MEDLSKAQRLLKQVFDSFPIGLLRQQFEGWVRFSSDRLGGSFVLQQSVELYEPQQPLLRIYLGESKIGLAAGQRI
uniref:Uncharacterized protein n=1 Tax=Bradyrhizobium ottawaense TaxID=931866 RepID=A0A2U8PFI2_9BRAD|nr:hypothetical protein CIT37_32060 [Bradyrhizobium ottawaense]